MSELYIAVTMTDGMVYHMAFQHSYRVAGGVVERAGTDGEIEFEIAKAERSWGRRSQNPVSVLSWRRLSQAEHEFVTREREYRDALQDDGAGINHNMPKARAQHLAMLRRERELRWPQLDAGWMRATGQGDAAEAARIEVQRQTLRDMPVTVAAALEAAQSIEALKLVGT